jgi:GTP-binding protein
MVNHGTGWVRMDYRIPARGLVGFRTEFMTETRGTGMLHHVFDGWEPWHGELRPSATARWWPTAAGMTTGYTR